MNEIGNINDALRVLLVEKEAEAISAIQSIFSEIKECALEVTDNYKQAVDRISSWEPDLVLLSHGLLNGNSLEAMKYISNTIPSIYVIVFLPSTETALIDEYIKTGANGFVFPDKNFTSGMMTAVKKALIQIVERKSFLLNSVSETSFFPPDDDSLDLLQLSSLQTEQVILHYRILEEIGEGGMGEVYLSEDQKLGRHVAIKVLPPRVTRNEKARLRLMREARLASGLNHPNIVTIHSIEETEDLSFIVMEYVQGESLWKILRSGPIQFLKVLDFGIQVADALAAAHAAGLVHRDIKPANIMISPRGQVKLLDFGLAKPVPSSEEKNSAFGNDLTGVGIPVGTVSYMSPEQTRGETVDTRSDIWSLGSVLYEAATGKPPFIGPSALAVMHEVATGTFIPPSQLIKEIPIEFDRIMNQAMQKDAQNRYSTIVEFSDDLRKLKGLIDKDLSDPALQSALIRSLIEPDSVSDPRSSRRILKRPFENKESRIFLVEDNEENRDMLSRRLQRRGFEVCTAVNGEEGVQRIPQEKPDLVIMDISLPVMDGFEASRQLKANSLSKEIPIIALTAHAMAGDKQKALEAGCDDYDTKPVDFDRLLKKITLWLEKKSGK